LSGGEKGGYKFTLTGNAGGYVITAVPVTFGTSGSRTFYSDQTMVIHQNFSAEPATISSPEMK
jgi:type IV pilus assembly protein PilA